MSLIDISTWGWVNDTDTDNDLLSISTLGYITTSSSIDPTPIPDGSLYQAKTWTQKMIFNGTASGDTFLEPILLGVECMGSTVYVKGTGTCNVRFSIDPQNSFWITPADGVITGAENGKTYSSNSHHNWMSVEVEDVSSMIIWVYRKINSRP